MVVEISLLKNSREEEDAKRGSKASVALHENCGNKMPFSRLHSKIEQYLVLVVAVLKQ